MGLYPKILVLTLLAAGAAGGARAAPLGETPFEVMMRWRPRTEVPEAPDFVKATRPAPERLDYAPLTGPEPKGPPRKSPEELEKLKSGLDAAASKNRARAARDFSVGAPRPRKRAR